MNPFQGTSDPFQARLQLAGQNVDYFSLPRLEQAGLGNMSQMPYSLKALLEPILRKQDDSVYTTEQIEAFFNRDKARANGVEIQNFPARVLGQDFTGVPLVVDYIHFMVEAVKRGIPLEKIKPLIPFQLVIDHSVRVGVDGRDMNALAANIMEESRLNAERFELLKWGGVKIPNFTIIPPGKGICHQFNCEYFATLVDVDVPSVGSRLAYMDSCFGTDSHTAMAGGLGILAWGVGGIEAISALLGVATPMLIPKTVGVRLEGTLPESVTAFSLVLHLTQLLRERGVKYKFVEFFGPSYAQLDVPTRLTIANMAPEYGATASFFPSDAATMEYLRNTGRDEDHVKMVEAYLRAQGMFVTPDAPQPIYDEEIVVDLSELGRVVAGPRFPHQKQDLTDLVGAYDAEMTAPTDAKPFPGFGMKPEDLSLTHDVTINGETHTLGHGFVGIAAITSCTSTSNPPLLVTAGLVARNLRERGLKIKPWVRPSFAPGSQVAEAMLESAGLMEDLKWMGFGAVGRGCTTCIGNSGDFMPEVKPALDAGVFGSATGSGNRNFDNRMTPDSKLNQLAAPHMVIAFAVSGTVRFDFATQPLGQDEEGNDVFLADVLPTKEEVEAIVREHNSRELYVEKYSPEALQGDSYWQGIDIAEGDLFEWPTDSTYIEEPVWCTKKTGPLGGFSPIENARVLIAGGDGITTDHISPAGKIKQGTPVADFLESRGVEAINFNSLGARRGQPSVMERGTWQNPGVDNRLVPRDQRNELFGTTLHHPSGEVVSIYEAARRYKEAEIPSIVFGGENMGMGSSRDWAPKGCRAQGIRAVIAVSFERIFRANAAFMGVAPFYFKKGETLDTLGLDGTESYTFADMSELGPGKSIEVTAVSADNVETVFRVDCALQTEQEVEIMLADGILPWMLERLS